MDALLKGMTRGEPLLVAGLVNTDSVERAKSVHRSFPTPTAALGRVMGGALLLSSFLKDRQKVMLQVSGDGPLQGVIAEADWGGRRSPDSVFRVSAPEAGSVPRSKDVGGGVRSGFLG